MARGMRPLRKGWGRGQYVCENDCVFDLRVMLMCTAVVVVVVVDVHLTNVAVQKHGPQYDSESGRSTSPSLLSQPHPVPHRPTTQLRVTSSPVHVHLPCVGGKWDVRGLKLYLATKFGYGITHIRPRAPRAPCISVIVCMRDCAGVNVHVCCMLAGLRACVARPVPISSTVTFSSCVFVRSSPYRKSSSQTNNPSNCTHTRSRCQSAAAHRRPFLCVCSSIHDSHL